MTDVQYGRRSDYIPSIGSLIVPQITENLIFYLFWIRGVTFIKSCDFTKVATYMKNCDFYERLCPFERVVIFSKSCDLPHKTQ